MSSYHFLTPAGQKHSLGTATYIHYEKKQVLVLDKCSLLLLRWFPFFSAAKTNVKNPSNSFADILTAVIQRRARSLVIH